MSVSFSRSIYFPSLVPDPNQPQPETLKWELENDSTLQAASITVPAGITTQALGGDVVATMEFFELGAPVAWGDLSGPNQSAIIAVLAAHEGRPISAEVQSKSKPGATACPGGASYTVVETFETAPLVEGTYEFDFTCNGSLDAAPVDFDANRLQLRVQFTDGEGVTNTRAQAQIRGDEPDSRSLKRTFTARAGEQVTIALEAKGSAVGIDCTVNRFEGVVRPV